MSNSTAGDRRTSLRLAPAIHDEIIAECAKRPGKVSVNTWILEAIMERLQRVYERSGKEGPRPHDR